MHVSSYTPGPWVVCDDGYGEECNPPEPGKRWLTIRGDDEEVAVLVRRGGEPTVSQHANAHLIALAPEMLAALEAVIAAWRALGDDDRWETSPPRSAMYAARNAAFLVVSKAKGGAA